MSGNALLHLTPAERRVIAAVRGMKGEPYAEPETRDGSSMLTSNEYQLLLALRAMIRESIP